MRVLATSKMGILRCPSYACFMNAKGRPRPEYDLHWFINDIITAQEYKKNLVDVLQNHPKGRKKTKKARRYQLCGCGATIELPRNRASCSSGALSPCVTCFSVGAAKRVPNVANQST